MLNEESTWKNVNATLIRRLPGYSILIILKK